jgi:hypothetical protein
MWIGNIDRCWETTQEVWSRRDAAAAAKAEKKNAPGQGGVMVHGESSKSKFVEEHAVEDLFLFSDVLNANGNLGGGGKKQTGGMGGRFYIGGGERRIDPVVEEMDPELTVRGRMHWVGVMKDWEWEPSLR